MRVCLALITTLLFTLLAPAYTHEGHSHDKPLQTATPVTPRGDNILTGTSAIELAALIRGAIQITNSKNQTARAKYKAEPSQIFRTKAFDAASTTCQASCK